MASQNIEIPNIQESVIKTPEDLAKALDIKQKREVADKVRKFAREQESVISQTEDWKSKLKETLDAQDQNTIREALPWEAKHFDKWLSTQQQLAWVIWAQWAETVWKFQWILDRFDHAGDVYKVVSESKGGMAWTFAGVMAAIMYFITGKAPEGFDFPWDKDKKKEGIENELWSPENVNENTPDIQYILWINALYALKWKERKTSKNILQSPEIKNSNFEKIKTESLNKTWIANRLWIKNFNDEEVYKEIQILLESESKIEKLLWEDFPNWKNEKLIDVIILLNKKWFLTIWKLQEKIDNINFSINPEDNINQLFESLWENLSIEYKDWKINYGDIENWDKLIWNISWSLITNIISSPWRINKSTNSVKLTSTIWADKKEDKEFLEKLIKFKDSIIPNLEGLLPSDKKPEIASFFNEEWRWLSLKELTELYIITWWNPNIREIWWVKSTLLYLKFWNILFKDRQWLAWAFANELHLRIINNDPLISEETKNFFGNILSVIWKSVWERFKWVMLDIRNYTDTSTKFIVWWAIWAYFLSKKIRYIVSWVWAAATTFLALKIFNELSKDPKAKARMEEHWIKNPTDLGKVLDETL